MYWWDYVKAVAVIALLVLAAYYATKLTARASGGRFKRSANMKLSGSLPLGKDKSVAIVKIGDFAYILGVGSQHVELIDKVPLSELPLAEEEDAAPLGEMFKRTQTGGESTFWQRFKEEFMSRLRGMFSRNGTQRTQGTRLPDEQGGFAEVLRKQSENKEQK